MSSLRMEDMGIEESPASIAYTLLVLMSALFDVAFTAREGVNESYIALVNANDTNQEYVRLFVSPVMADLLVAVLQDVGPKVQEAAGRPQWHSMI